MTSSTVDTQHVRVTTLVVTADLLTVELSDGRSREFKILRLNAADAKKQKFYVFFTAPADVRRMAYLVHKKTGWASPLSAGPEKCWTKY